MGISKEKGVVLSLKRAADNSTAVESTVDMPAHGHHGSSHTGTASTSCTFCHLLSRDSLKQLGHKVL